MSPPRENTPCENTPRESAGHEHCPLAQTRYDVLAVRPLMGIVWQIFPSGRRVIAIDARPEACCSGELPGENLPGENLSYKGSG